MFWVSKLKKLFHLVWQKDLRNIRKFGAKNNMFGITVVIAKNNICFFLATYHANLHHHNGI